MDRCMDKNQYGRYKEDFEGMNGQGDKSTGGRIQCHENQREFPARLQAP